MRLPRPLVPLALMVAVSSVSADAAGAVVDARGWLVSPHDAHKTLVSGQGWPVNVQVNDDWFLGDAAGVTVSQETFDGGAVVVHYVTDTGKLSWRHTLFPALGEHAWLRTLVYENTSDKAQDITGVRMDASLNLPDAPLVWNPRTFYMARSADDRLVALAYKGTTEHYNIAHRDGAVGHDIHACWRLAPGETATIEAQGVWVREVEGGGALDARGWGEAFRAEAQRWYDAIGLHVPDGMPDWARSMILYEYNAGGHIDSRFSDVGGFQQLAKQTDYLAALGVTAVWLQAAHEHKTPPDPVEGGWNLYDPRDVLAIDAIMGGEAGLRELCDSLHKAGIHILGESVPHGGHSIQGQAMPAWWSYERDGTACRNWGGCGMDYASPEWQRILSESMAWQTREFGYVGCRIDVADGSGPNWKSPRTNHASYSTLGGALELLGALRAAMSAHVDHPILIPEAFDQVEYFRITPVGYGHDFWMFTVNEAQPLANDPAAMAAAFRVYLERERGSLPRGALTLRTLNNHDTACEAGRVHQRFGVGLARALHGLCLMIPGIPMLYQEQEIGDWFALRDLHRARRSIPEFSAEEVDYYAATFAPEVFACLRGNAEDLALGLVNLSGVAIADVVQFASWVNIPDGATVYDGVAGNTATVNDNGFSWTLAPYQTALMRIGNPPEVLELSDYGTAPVATGLTTVTAPEPSLEMGELYFVYGDMRLRFEAGAGEWRLGADDGEGRTYMNDIAELRMSSMGEGLHCELIFSHADTDAWPALVVADAHTWRVSGRTAVLHDHVLRRHFPWPEASGYVWDKTMYWGPNPAHALYRRTSPTGRLWESVIEPLHPDAPAVAFHDGQDRRILAHALHTDAHNVVLRDAVATDAHVLRLEFRGHDAELAAHVSASALGRPYRLDLPLPTGRELYTASFVLAGIAGNTAEIERGLLETPRLQTAHGGFQVVIEGDNAQKNTSLGIVLPQRGTATWKNLNFPEGQHRLQLTLRHSEHGPDGRDMDDAYALFLDDVAISYEWTERNVFRSGNAYYGHVRTESRMFTDQPVALVIKTKRPWCMMKEQFTLIPVE